LAEVPLPLQMANHMKKRVPRELDMITG
jgi:hypothetical protein